LLQHSVKPATPTADYKYDNDYAAIAWLKTGYAGSGPLKLRDWRANEAVVLERNDNYYGEKPKLESRHLPFHVKESAARSAWRLRIGDDVDIARNL
jgi:peptide/nickel transport system substrate-binding protein